MSSYTSSMNAFKNIIFDAEWSEATSPKDKSQNKNKKETEYEDYKLFLEKLDSIENKQKSILNLILKKNESIEENLKDNNSWAFQTKYHSNIYNFSDHFEINARIIYFLELPVFISGYIIAYNRPQSTSIQKICSVDKESMEVVQPNAFLHFLPMLFINYVIIAFVLSWAIAVMCFILYFFQKIF